MFRSVHTSVLDLKRKKIVVRIESEECESETKNYVRNKILDNIAMNPSILEVDSPFQIMRMYYNGSKWIVETETLVEGE